MIIIYHQYNIVISVIKDGLEIPFENHDIAKTLYVFSKNFPAEWLIWCHIELKEYLNTASFETINS